MPVVLPAAASAASGLISGVTGFFQAKKGNKMLNGLHYPTEGVPAAVQGIENEGLPQQQYDKAMRDIQRQQMQALGGAQDRRGGLDTIGKIQAGTNDATLNLNAKDAAMNVQNRQYMAGIQRDLYDRNVRQKYNRDYDYAMGLLGMGNQNMMGGLDKLVGAGTMYGAGKQNQQNNQLYSQSFLPHQ